MASVKQLTLKIFSSFFLPMWILFQFSITLISLSVLKRQTAKNSRAQLTELQEYPARRIITTHASNLDFTGTSPLTCPTSPLNFIALAPMVLSVYFRRYFGRIFSTALNNGFAV